MKTLYFILPIYLLAHFSYAQCTVPSGNVVYDSDCILDQEHITVNPGRGADIKIQKNDNPDITTNVVWNVEAFIIRGWTVIFYTDLGSLTVDEGTSLTINGDLTMAEFGKLTVNGELIVNGNLTHTVGYSFGDRFNVGKNGIVTVNGDLDLAGPFNYDGIRGTLEGELIVTGSIDGIVNLPVELTYLEAYGEDEKVIVEWETASEHNASHFDIQRSSDRKHWETIGTVRAGGNSQNVISYTFVDESPISNAFYRLKQVDFDSEYELFGPIEVISDGITQEMNATFMPNNITKGESFQMSISGLNGGNALSIQVYNNQGNKVYAEQVDEIDSSTYLKPMDFTQHLNSGMYYVLIKSGRQVVRERLLIR
ncbi:T9SS type A sorting domain-containing protein [Flammeovirga aprica]|uniref:T9SS type A sorting domain-containing protein n=1 Tax=Flammeovirga aprica JL-4 TaxID=694437 RepID=A0A7X9S013_9BACT|nr:T9SS type A sorting domain-containing protein [Flammeovirga aprica]NME71910.1 T9SS type A sorting domain-containing protein [Flammeovirga aprica JL-4]